MGGCPFIIDGTGEEVKGYMAPNYSLEEMEQENRNSIYCDGIENVEDGCLIYTDELIEKAKNKFNVTIPKFIPIREAETVADLLINGVIKLFS